MALRRLLALVLGKTAELPVGDALLVKEVHLEGLPSAPSADVVSLGKKSLAGWGLPSFISEFGECELQPMFGRNRVYGYFLHSNVQTFGGAVGTTPGTVGTLTGAGALVATNRFTSEMFGIITSAATANALATIHHSSTGRRDVLINAGGFCYITRFGLGDPVVVSDARMFIGLSTQTVTPTNVAPSTLTNSAGMGTVDGSNNFHIIWGGSTPQAPIDLGANFPCNTSLTDVYELILFNPPNSNDIIYRVERLNTGHVATGTLVNSNSPVTLPTSTFCLVRAWRTNNATAAAVALHIAFILVHKP